MSVKTFGTHKDTAQTEQRDYFVEMQKIAPGCPISVSVSPAGELIGASYETQWQEGTTTPVENKKGEVEYEQDYTKHKLTKEQAKKLDAYIEDNLASE